MTAPTHHTMGESTSPSRSSLSIAFGFPLLLWSISFLYSKYRKWDFSRWYTIHNVHNFGAMFLAVGSLSETFPEYVPISWSLSYFCIDAIDCILRRDVVYFLHAAFCLVLGMCNYSYGMFYALKMNSKASFCELSNPFMHLAKSTRHPIHMVLFMLVFTACRMIWIPIMVRQLVPRVGYQHPALWILFGFYLLNGFWYYKIWRIIYKGIADRTRQQKDH